jgi:DNA (cytosine-5)-methyltransferase 1
MLPPTVADTPDGWGTAALSSAPADVQAWLYGYDTGVLRSVADVLPTQTTVQGDALLSRLLDVAAAEVDDCLFRMLFPAEIQAGMAFPSSYEVLGNKREQVRLLGNAVTPPAMRDLIAAVAESLGAVVATA